MMDSATMAFWVGGVGQVAAAFATGFVVWQTRKMLDRGDRSERLEVFMAFSREYDTLKENISQASLDDEKFAAAIAAGKTPSADISAAIDLLRLFERQQFLHASNMIDAALWKIWKSGINRHMRTGLFQHVWAHRKSIPAARHLSERFVHWVDTTFMSDIAAPLPVSKEGK